MPKLKRYENLQNSFYSGPTSQAVAQSSSTESESWHLNESELNQNLRQKKLTSFLQPIARPRPSVQDAPIPSVQAASQQEPSKNRRSKSTPHWMVDVIDVQGGIKKLKMKTKDVLNLSNGERIIVDFDDVHSPIGAGQGILARFCGIIATDSSIFPIHFERWPDIPSTYFNRCFDQFIKPRFFLRTSEDNGRRYVYNSMCKKWGAKRLKRFDKVYDPLMGRAELMEKVPRGIPKDQWVSYVDYRLKEKTQKMCKTNAENRKRQTISHIGGSKPNSRRRAEIMAETGKNPGRGQLYLATHKNEDGSYVNEAAKEICEKIELAMTQSVTDESEISPNDAVGKVLGKEHPGRVRCLGLGVVPSRVFKEKRPRYNNLDASSSNSGSCSSQCQEKYNQMLKAHNQSQENYNSMMNAHSQMMNAFKAYMIMKEGAIPQQFAGIFGSTTPSTPSDAASGPISPMDVRSYGGSNRGN